MFDHVHVCNHMQNDKERKAYKIITISHLVIKQGMYLNLISKMVPVQPTMIQ